MCWWRKATWGVASLPVATKTVLSVCPPAACCPTRPWFGETPDWESRTWLPVISQWVIIETLITIKRSKRNNQRQTHLDRHFVVVVRLIIGWHFHWIVPPPEVDAQACEQFFSLRAIYFIHPLHSHFLLQTQKAIQPQCHGGTLTIQQYM